MRTLLHEQLEGRCASRLSVKKYKEILDSVEKELYCKLTTDAYIERVVDRFFKAKGW